MEPFKNPTLMLALFGSVTLLLLLMSCACFLRLLGIRPEFFDLLQLLSIPYVLDSLFQTVRFVRIHSLVALSHLPLENYPASSSGLVTLNYSLPFSVAVLTQSKFGFFWPERYYLLVNAFICLYVTDLAGPGALLNYALKCLAAGLFLFFVTPVWLWKTLDKLRQHIFKLILSAYSFVYLISLQK
jgi:hypothetical protein